MMGQATSSPTSSDTAQAPLEKHFVLKTPLTPDPALGLHSAVFATGCFWGVRHIPLRGAYVADACNATRAQSEKSFWRMPGVYTTAVGYVAGTKQEPTYEEVCTGRTGHTEAVQVFWDPAKLSFADVMRNYLESHDPTQGNGQGNDRGTQYRSGVYPRTDEDIEVAKAALAAYSKALGRAVTSEVKDGRTLPFYFAEDYHQQYLAKPGARPYCSAMPTGVSLPPFEQWAPKGATPPKLPESYVGSALCSSRPRARLANPCAVYAVGKARVLARVRDQATAHANRVDRLAAR